MEDFPNKPLKLSLERPYKDDNGDKIPVLFDIAPDGQRIYEPYVSYQLTHLSRLMPFSKPHSTSALGEKLRRIFVERGYDFFEKQKGGPLQERAPILEGQAPADDTFDGSDPARGDGHAITRIMSTEELFNMRMEILPQLL
jgi:mediator of RNA polymerase II transcription subunit 17